MPHLVFVGNGQALARINPTVSFQQLACSFDGLSSGAATLQHQLAKPLAINESAVGLQLAATPESGFANSQLLFVNARISGIQELISMCHLRNLAHRNIVVAVHLARFILCPHALIHGFLFPSGMVRRFFHRDISARAAAVVGMRGHHRTVSRGFLAHGHAGAFHSLSEFIGTIPILALCPHKGQSKNKGQ